MIVYGSPNVTTKYCYDGDQVIAEYDGSNTLLRKFIYGPGIDEPVCMQRLSFMFWVNKEKYKCLVHLEIML